MLLTGVEINIARWYLCQKDDNSIQRKLYLFFAKLYNIQHTHTHTHTHTHMLYIPTAQLRPAYSGNSLQQILEFICFTYSFIHSLNKCLWAYTLCQELSRISYQKEKKFTFFHLLLAITIVTFSVSCLPLIVTALKEERRWAKAFRGRP